MSIIILSGLQNFYIRNFDECIPIDNLTTAG